MIEQDGPDFVAGLTAALATQIHLSAVDEARTTTVQTTRHGLRRFDGLVRLSSRCVQPRMMVRGLSQLHQA